MKKEQALQNTDITLPVSILDFPEIDDGGVKVYGETSMENQMAVLSHYLHGSVPVGDFSRHDVLNAIKNYLTHKAKIQNQTKQIGDYEDLTADNVSTVAERAFEYGLFDEFFKVPFPDPVHGKRTFIDLFAGIGGIRLPFSEMGYKCVFSSEWDTHAQKTYFANFGEMPFGDITKIKADNIPTHDILLAGFPCQAFSIMGKQRGFEDTRGTMFFEIERILGYHHPKAILLENVKQLVTHDHGATFRVIQERLTRLGYFFKWKILNALDFGLPQKRERVIIVGFMDKRMCNDFTFDLPNKKYDLSSILENDDEVDSSLFASDMIQRKRKESTKDKDIFYPSIWHENKSGNISILPYACALRTGASYNYLLVNGIRRPSSRELLRLQGFPDNYVIAVSHSEIRRQTGNSVAVPIIRAVAKKIDQILNRYEAS